MAKLLLPDGNSEQLAEFKAALQKTLPKSNLITFKSSFLLETAGNEEPDIVFLPFENETEKEDGSVWCKLLKTAERTKDIPVVLIGQKNKEPGNRIKALEAGAEFFLPLPADVMDLKALVNVLLKIRENNIRLKNEKEHQYKMLFESASDFVFLHHFDNNNGAGKIVEVSDAACERLGYTREELIQIRPLDLTPKANLKVSEISKQLAKTGRLKFEQTLISKNGEQIPIEVLARVIQYKGNQMVLSIGRDVTDRNNAIEQLKLSEERFEKFFKSSPVPESIWRIDGKTFKLIDVNNAGLKESEGRALNYVGMTAEEVYSDRKDIIERLHFCVDKRRNLVYETEFTVRDIKRWIIFTYVYISDEMLLLHTEDITEQKRAQKELEESELKFRSLISEMDQGLAVHEPVFNEIGKMVNYRFLDFNESFEKQTGLKRNETIGKTLLEVMPDAENYLFEQYEKVVKKGVVAHFEQFSRALGRYYEIVAYRNRKNQFATVISDITERKKQIKELSLHNERLEVLTKILKHDFKDSKELLEYTINQAVNLTESESGFIFYYSEETRKFSLQAWSGNVENECHVGDSRTGYTLESAGCWAEAVRKRKAIIINDYENFDGPKKGIPDGHFKLKRFLTAPVVVDGEIKAVVGVANKETDYEEKDVKQVTLLMDTLWKMVETKIHDEELLAAKDKAEESDRLKSAFLANMSHEIRTPMNGILGFVEMLKESRLSEAEKGDYIDIIEKSGKRMLNTLSELMDISRIESKLVEVVNAEINIGEQLQKLHKSFEPEASSKGLQLTLTGNQTVKNKIIQTDIEKFYAILANLIKNAIKYTDSGFVEFGCKELASGVQFFVKDTGIGIDKDRQEAIFKHFVQEDNSLSKPYEGVGLGLSIASAYAEMLGGRIWLESEKGKGSVFWFELPQQGKTEKMKVDEEIVAVKSEDEVLKNLTILVAEDDEVGRLYLQQLLEDKCQKVFYALNGKEAVEIYRENQDIDLILMDIKMPVMDGYSATIKIKAINHEAKVIAQTAYALSGDREKAFAAGCDDYVTKPLSKETLMSTIDKLLT